MQRKTHLALGFLVGSIFFCFGVSWVYILLIGFASYFPNLDWYVLHRRIFHNVWAMVILILPFGYFSNWDLLTVLGIIVGYASHLLLDSLTFTGIHWIWPVEKLYLQGIVSTGGLTNSVLFGLFLVLGGVFLGMGLYNIRVLQEPYQVVVIAGVVVLLGISLWLLLRKVLGVEEEDADDDEDFD